MPSEPFYWQEKDGWYLWTRTIENKRKRVFLAKKRKDAFTKWKSRSESHELGDASFSYVAREWLLRQKARCERREVSKEWLARVDRTVEAFSKANPSIKCSRITPTVALGWLDNPSVSYEQTQVSTLKQILKWAVDNRMIGSSPIAGLRLSKGKRREVLITIEEHRRLVAASISPRIRAILWFAWWTGSRPSELRSLTWQQLNDDCTRATLKEHKTAKQTDRPRIIYFPHLASVLLRKYRRPSGLVFLNSHGSPWTKDALVRVMDRLRKKTGLSPTPYAYRHSYITRALEQGHNTADVAELVGTSIEVISRNYAHLDKSKQRLGDIAKSVK